MEKRWCNEMRLLQLQSQWISRCKHAKSLNAFSWKKKKAKTEQKELQLVQLTIVNKPSGSQSFVSQGNRGSEHWQTLTDDCAEERAENTSLLSHVMHGTHSNVPPQVGCSTARRCVRRKGRCGRWWSGASSSRWTSWSWSRPPRTNGPANNQVTLEVNKEMPQGWTLRWKQSSLLVCFEANEWNRMWN